MARFIYLAGVDEAASVRFPDGFTISSAAEQGTVGIGTIEIDDPNGTYDLKPLNPAYIVETAASPQRLWTGFLYNLTIDRGPFKNAAGRVWRADCVDINWKLTERIILSANGTRPAETDLARLTWLLANPAMTGLVYSGSLTDLTNNARGLDAADYRYQTPMEILADIAPQCGKVAFAFYNPSTARTELFYDLQTASTYDSTAKISNVLGDIGAGVYQPFMDASMERVGENIASKAVLRWVGGVTTGENLATKSTYGEMTYTWDSSRVGKATTAASQVAAILAGHSGPDETVTCKVIMAAANVNDLLEGQRVQGKFSHLPGFSAYTYARVIKRAVAVDESDQYLVQFTLSNKVRVGLGGGPGTGTLPAPPPQAAVHWYSGTFTFTSDDTGSAFGPGAGTTISSTNTTVATFTPGLYNYHFDWSASGGLTSMAVGVAQASTAWGVQHLVGFDGNGSRDNSFTVASTASLYAQMSAAAISHITSTVTVNFWIDPDGWDTGTTPQPPKTAQWVYNETPTPTPGGGNRVFYTVWPYAVGSLTVKVDDIVQTVTESNPATGQFTLAFDPRSFEAITCTYQGL